MAGIGDRPLVAGAAALTLVAAVVLGGSSAPGAWANAVVRLTALALVATLLLQPRAVSLRHLRLPLAIGAGIVGLILLQLLPLSPEVWANLPGRSPFADALAAAGQPTLWRPMTLDPQATWGALLACIPPFAVFLAVAGLDKAARRSLTLLLIGLGGVAFLLGLAQLAQGTGSALRLHPYANWGSSVGFFANRNHHASFLYTLVPLAAAWLIGFTGRAHRNNAGMTAMVLVLIGLLLGIGMALSRAGVALAGVAFVASMVLALLNRTVQRRHLVIGIGGVGIVAALLFVNFALFDVLARFERDLGADGRFVIYEVSLEAGKAFQPFGSGFGTFVPVFEMFEPVAALTNAYVNHAHNDYIEIWLEGGWPAIALLLVFLAWLASATLRWWRQAPPSVPIERAASISIILLLLHSWVEYPLRSVTMGVVFALLCGLLVPAREPGRAHHRRHHADAPGATEHASPAA